MKDTYILIVEDEQIIAENLRFILNDYGYKFVDVAIDAYDAKAMFKQRTFDLVLMDINLGDQSPIDGIDLIKELLLSYQFGYIYVTANADEYTINKAKETSPLGYIVKPFNNPSIYANVEMALNSLKSEDIFSYNNQGMKCQLKLSEILYLEADGAYATIYSSDGNTHFVRLSLSEFNLKYSENFVRIHKSTIINKNHIQAHSSQFVKINDQKLAIGRTYKKLFLQQVKNISFT